MCGYICPVLPGASAYVKLWDKYGPQRTKRCFTKLEVGIHDGAYRGRLHSHILFIDGKTISVRQKTYDDIHGHGWIICLPTFGLGGLLMTFGWGPMKILALFAM